MPRPRLDYTNKTIGTLLIGRRVEGGVHARFEYTCNTCGATGERDARHIIRGCSNCKALAVIEGTNRNLAVATALETFSITPLQILMVLRKHPEHRDTPDGMRVRFYYEGKRVKVTEDLEYVHVSQAAREGVPVKLSYSKFEQELEEGYSISLPEEPAPKLDYSAYFGDPDAPDPFATHLDLARALVQEVPLPPPPPPFTPPEGWLKLERESDSVWLKPDYPPEGQCPPYLIDWLSLHPDCSYRVIPTAGDLYAAASPLPAKKSKPMFDFDEMDEEEDALENQRKRERTEELALAGIRPERVLAKQAKVAYFKQRAEADRAATLYNVQPLPENLVKWQEQQALQEKAKDDLDTAECLADIAEKEETQPKD